MAISKLGLRGVLKSLRQSRYWTDRLESLLVHPNVILDISPQADIDIDGDGRLLLGFIGETSASHPELMNSKFHLGDDASLTITDGAARVGPCSVVHVDGEFTMGHSYFNSHAKILCEDRITVGDDCAIAWHVELSDSDMHPYAIAGDRVQTRAPIEIRDDVWIGSNVQIKKGVTVGEGAIVASGSVVTNDVPPHTLVGGVPAEQIYSDVERLD